MECAGECGQWGPGREGKVCPGKATPVFCGQCIIQTDKINLVLKPIFFCWHPENISAQQRSGKRNQSPGGQCLCFPDVRESIIQGSDQVPGCPNLSFKESCPLLHLMSGAVPSGGWANPQSLVSPEGSRALISEPIALDQCSSVSVLLSLFLCKPVRSIHKGREPTGVGIQGSTGSQEQCCPMEMGAAKVI